MDFYRAHLQAGSASMRAPNGQDISMYAPSGRPAGPSLTAVDKEEFSPIEYMLAFRLMIPFIEYVRQPLVNLWYRVMKPRTEKRKTVKVLLGQHVSALAKPVTCMLATLSLAGAIGVLDSIDDSKIRIVVMTVFGLGFASSVSFFGQESMQIYQLVTA